MQTNTSLIQFTSALVKLKCSPLKRCNCVGSQYSLQSYSVAHCCREEIEATAFQLQDRLEQMETSNKDLDPLLVLPLYSELPGERQALIFDAAPPGARKCVIATNIAETSLTIDGIKYVIDCGYCKFKVFSPKMGMDSLQVLFLSPLQLAALFLVRRCATMKIVFATTKHVLGYPPLQ